MELFVVAFMASPVVLVAIIAVCGATYALYRSQNSTHYHYHEHRHVTVTVQPPALPQLPPNQDGAQRVQEFYEAYLKRSQYWPEQFPGETDEEWLLRYKRIRECSQLEGARHRIANHPELYLPPARR